MASHVVFIVNPPGYDEAFKSLTGVVGRHITELTLRTRVAAVIQAPKPGTPPINRTGVSYATGRLAARITSSVGHATGIGGREVEGRVTSDTSYSMYVTQGTNPHLIFARPGRFLAFRRHRVGPLVLAKVVHHPGTMANDFLTRALEMSVL